MYSGWTDVWRHTGIEWKSPSTNDYSTDEEESDEEDNPIQLKKDEIKLSEQEKTETFKDKSEMSPGEA